MSLHNLYAQVTKNNKRRALSGLLMVSVLLALACVPAFINLASADPEGDVAINEVNFPDPNFRSFITKKFDKDKNGVLSPSERSKIHSLNCSKKNISNLKGIEFFPSITTLDCSKNQISSLDLSRNTNLKRLFCSNNQLSTLNLENNTDLSKLSCSNNKLTELDVSHNSKLKTLKCDNNQLAALDLTHNTTLSELDCSNNQLSTLNLEKNTNLEKLNCANNKLAVLDTSALHLAEFNGTAQNVSVASQEYLSFDLSLLSKNIDPKKMTNIQGGTISGNTLRVPRPNSKLMYSYATDASGHTLEVSISITISNFKVPIDEANFPDATFRKYVLEAFDTNKDGYLSKEERDAVTTFKFPESYFAVFQYPLNPDIMKARYLNVKTLTGLEYFTNLEELNINHVFVDSVDLTPFKKLKKFYWAFEAGSLGDPEGFTWGGGSYFTHNGKALNLASNTELEAVCIAGLKLDYSPDFSKNTKLKYLDCRDCAYPNYEIESYYYYRNFGLDVTNCKELEELYCDDCGLKTLDLKNNTKLKKLSVMDNYLTRLDAKNLNLESFISSSNIGRSYGCNKAYCYYDVTSHIVDMSKDLKDLDLSKVTNLKGATISDNRILITNYDDGIKKGYTTFEYDYIIDDSNHLLYVEVETRPAITISYDSNGGTGSMPDDTVHLTYNGTTGSYAYDYYLPDCKFQAPAGKVFWKWEIIGTYYDETGKYIQNDKYQYSGSHVAFPLSKVTIKAIWRSVADVVSKIDSPDKPSSDFVSVTLKAAANGTIKNTEEAKGLDFWVKKNTQFSKVLEHVTVSADAKYKEGDWTNAENQKIEDAFAITSDLVATKNFVYDYATDDVVSKIDSPDKPSSDFVSVTLKAAANGSITNKEEAKGLDFWVKKNTQFSKVTEHVTVTAADKYKFDKWTNEQGGAEVKDDFVITEALTACANFVPQDSSNPQGSASGTEGGGYSNGLVTMYRLYNPYSHEHLFTTDIMERDNLIPLGWKYELAVGGVYLHGEKGGVYRLYNPTTGEHHYTMDEEELANCVKAGWVNEGVKFFSASGDDGLVVGMVSMYNPYEKAFYHHYTSDEKEIEKMVKDGWIKEDIKWYVAK